MRQMVKEMEWTQQITLQKPTRMTGLDLMFQHNCHYWNWKKKKKLHKKMANG